MQFHQPDTLILKSYNPQSYNRYAYANNNPIRYTDPMGHSAWDGEGGAADMEKIDRRLRIILTKSKSGDVYKQN